jgi:hypothetical protein
MASPTRLLIGPALSLALALAGAAVVGLAVTAPISQAAGDQNTSTVAGEVMARPGKTALMTDRDAAFADGTTTTTFRLPRSDRSRLRLATDARAKDGSAYRATLRFAHRRPVLLLQKIRNGKAVKLDSARVNRRIQRAVRIQLRTVGNRIKARAWAPGRSTPRWQVSRVDAAPLRHVGRPRLRVTLGKRAARALPVEYRLASKPERCTPERPCPGPAPTPSPTGCPEVGVYNGSTPDYDLDTVRQFGAAPQVANSYYQPTQAINVAKETERIRRGTSPNITITTKGTDLIEVLATGSSHPKFAEASAWLNAHIDALSRLADVDPAVPVYATLEHEYKVKIRLAYVTGPSADPVNYGRALDLFYKRAHARNSLIRTTYWMVGSDRAVEGTVGEQFTTLPKAILFDPYATGSGTQTVTSIATADLDWIKDQSWYVGQEVGLGEFGMQVVFGDTALGRFFTNVRRQLKTLGISWAVFFNRQRDLDTRIAERTDGKVFPKGKSSFATTLKSTGAC